MKTDMKAPTLSRSNLLGILRRGIENAIFILMVRKDIYDRKSLSDIFTYMGVLVIVAFLIENGVERVVTETNTNLNSAICVGLLVILYCRMSKRFNNGKICLPTI